MIKTTLLATDQQRSVLNVRHAAGSHSLVYTLYGHRPRKYGLLSLLGFNGERAESATGCYLLGNGYRAFNPVLMRFNSPDSWSPFREGEINTYVYCAGDPVNFSDPTGHVLAKLTTLVTSFKKTAHTATLISKGADTPKAADNFIDNMVTTTRDALTYNTRFTGSLSPPRQHLKDTIGAIQDPSPYAQTLGAVNNNLGSNSNMALTMAQAEAYGSLALNSSAGRISNTTAHLQEAGYWARKYRSDKQPDSMMGAALNFGGAFASGVTDAKSLKTGDALRRNSLSVRKISTSGNQR